MTRRKVNRNSQCPCGSGKKYGHCCHEKGYKFFKDSNGTVVKEIPLSDKALEVFDDSIADFEATLGRPPGNEDPMFLGTLLFSDKEHTSVMIEVLRDAGVEEKYIYAYHKTGITVSEENQNLFSDKDLQEWTEAVHEYELKESTGELYKNSFLDELMNGLEHMNLLQSLIIWRRNVINDNPIDLVHLTDANDYVFFCLTRNIKLNRACTKLIEGGLGEASLSLIRSIYENYIHLFGALSNRSDILIKQVKAQAGVKLGTHKEDYGAKGRKKIINKENSEKIDLKSTRELVKIYQKESHYVNTYDYLYSTFSSHIHSNLNSFQSYISPQGFDFLSESHVSESLIFLYYFNILQLKCLRTSSVISDISKKDVEHFMDRYASKVEKGILELNQIYQDMPKDVLHTFNTP